MAVTDALTRRLKPAGRNRRRAATTPGRTHIEVKGIHRPEHERLRVELKAALERVDGVQWAEVNAVLGRVVVAFDEDATGEDALADIVGELEESHGLAADRFPFERPDHPGDAGPVRRAAIAMTADAAGIAVSISTAWLRAVPIPIELASAVSVLENEPRLRSAVESWLGPTGTDVTLGVASAIAQGLGQGALGLVVDLGHRLSALAEARSRLHLWHETDQRLQDDGASHAADPVARHRRAVPLPPGPVEIYADRAALAATGAAAVTFALTASPRRAASLLVGGIPKPARLGREAFAEHLGRVLAARGILVLDPGVLRRIDRVDTVVVDARTVDLNLPGLRSVTAAVREAGHMLVIAGADDETVRRLGGDLAVGRDAALTEAIRGLQTDGCVVALIGGDPEALAAADFGVGVAQEGDALPWAADVVCRRRLEEALVDSEFLVAATHVAHEVSRQSAALALMSSATASMFAISAAVPGSGRRAVTSVNVGALLAMANGTRAAWQLDRRPARRVHVPTPWHELEADEALRRLESSSAGLTAAEAERRQRPASNDNLPAPIRLGRRVVEELANPLTPVLAAGAGLSAAVGSTTDAVIVAAVSGLNALVSGVQLFRADDAIRALSAVSTGEISVRRDGEIHSVPPDTLVPGDIVVLEAGDAVPADCRIVATDHLEVDESALTGESVPVVKSPAPRPAALLAERASMLYDGTTIAAGSVEAVVVAVADDTEGAKASEPTNATAPQVGVEARLRELTSRITPVAILGGAGVVIAGLLRGRPLQAGLATGVNLAVAAVPEGLPMLSTLAQVAAAERLSRRGVLVHNARAVEALGRVEVLCTDKTGTLTEGRLEVAFVSDGRRDFAAAQLTTAGEEVLAAALRATPAPANGREVPHLTDRAVLTAAERAGVPEDLGVPGWHRVEELPFEPGRGLHCTLGEVGGQHRLSVKGAPEVVLPACRRWKGHREALSGADRARLRDEVDRLARRGLRILAVAEKLMTDAGSSSLTQSDAADMEFVGLVALADPIRPSAAAAVEGVRRAGVEIVMVTGDHPSTARGIATELGILNGHRVLTGGDLDAMTDETLDAVISDVSVFARVTPADKVRIVAAYQRARRPVAMTGDGANDAPAIRLADVGVAVGPSSTPAARSAADVVVTDDRVETIVDAIIEGRAMWTSVRDALGILLGGNLGEVGFTVAASAMTGRSPLSTRQLLLVNLLTDVAPALAIALRPPSQRSPDDLLAEGPERSLGSSLDRAILLRGATTAAGAMLAWTIARATGPRRRADTVALTALVGTQLAQTLLVGGRQPATVAAGLGSAAILAAVVQTPGVSQFFGCTPLDPLAWAISLGSAAAVPLLTVAAPAAVRALRTA